MKAYVFPGQGAQFSGMGKDLYDQFDWAKDLFAEADSILGFKISDIMFNGSDEDLRRTDITKPAVRLVRTELRACIYSAAAGITRVPVETIRAVTAGC